jgi:hypothetical protein
MVMQIENSAELAFAKHATLESINYTMIFLLIYCSKKVRKISPYILHNAIDDHHQFITNILHLQHNDALACFLIQSAEKKISCSCSLHK